MIEQQNIEHLVRKAQRGNGGAKEELVQLFHPLLVKSIRKYFGINQDTEDWLQEGRVVILKAIKEYKESLGVPFAAYVQKQVFYYYVNERKKTREVVILDQPLGEDNTSYLDLLSDDREQVEERMEEKEQRNSLDRAMSLLSLKQREVILAYYVEGKKLKSLAREKNLSYQAIVKRKARALTQLNKMMKG
ncbi:sigma-70 family RNA polymerase sigma factor [Irregularibacter muris]|uniref:Sigma-70 family RNA polymerase sigma factor n=1 Tax=Irregularibacter muris TaxID=1796619 RepID=A0AAE3HGN0_9FIRM|nr:sigma-70 family RNA polymerase sigma factor [Irregularibacter muris]MCR1898253.1 sigma-70 family RNA polymerase sigma factor [Irregularibacter muris]